MRLTSARLTANHEARDDLRGTKWARSRTYAVFNTSFFPCDVSTQTAILEMM